MICIPSALLHVASTAGIKCPPDADSYDPNEYPHWHVYLTKQCGAAMPSPTSHWRNAEVVAAIPEDKIRLVTHDELVELGFSIGNSVP